VDYLQSVILGIVEGLTEFLPVSSTGHLTITEKILGLKVDDPAVTAYTAVIQMGAIVAVLLYFRADITRIAVAWLKGLVKPEYRGTFDHRFGWYIIAGSVPIGIVGFLGKDVVSGPLRSLWWVGGALVVWSAVMWFAERAPSQERGERDLTMTDALVVGALQCVALIPGVSRSGATISGGLLRGLDRVAASRLRVFLSIPALSAAVGLVAAPTLVAGVYGMNFQHMPELGWMLGYPMSLLLMVSSSLAIFIVARRAGWL
jgi:undecaprenyl-diphosphatase